MVGGVEPGGLVDLVVTRVAQDLDLSTGAFYLDPAARGTPSRGDAGSHRRRPATEELIRWALRARRPCEAPPQAPTPSSPFRCGDGQAPRGPRLLAPALLRRGRDEPPLDASPASSPSPSSGWTASSPPREWPPRWRRSTTSGSRRRPCGTSRALFARATEEAGRLVEADHTSVLRLSGRCCGPSRSGAGSRGAGRSSPRSFAWARASPAASPCA